MIPLGNQATLHCMQAFHPCGAPQTVTHVGPSSVGQLPNWGL